jgi:TonB-dependent starch-binding outer membrane protein SusC
MSRLRWVFLLAATAALPAVASAQERGSITGTVVEQATRAPLASVQVTVVGTAARAITNQDGRYTLQGIPAGTAEVRATRIGYGQGAQTVRVVAGEAATADFALSPSAIALEGVIVTASGQEARTRTLGNAVGMINAADVELATVTNMSDLLSGRSAGVTIMQSSGTTGAGSRVRIRGSNSVSLSNEPLLIVDGVRVNNAASSFSIATGGQAPSRLDDINPDDIESIEILKGPAAAALYGTAAANGVIQITTRRGRAGATRWGFYTEQGRVLERTPWPDNVVSESGCVVFDVAEGDCAEIGPLIRFNPLRNPATTPFIDGSRHVFGMNVSGGAESITYYLSAETEREQGVYEPNKLARINLRANIQSELHPNLNVSLRTGFVNSSLGMPQNDNNFLGPILQGMLGHPDTTISNSGYLWIDWNELKRLEAEQDVRRFMASTNVNFRPLEWLRIVGTSGLDLLGRHDQEFAGRGHVVSLGPPLDEGIRRSNRIEILNLTSTLDGTSTVEVVPNVVATTSLGVQLNREDYRDTRAYGVGVVPGTKSLIGTSRLFSVAENNIFNTTLGAYGQQQFGWNDRLFVTAALRADNNSAFGSDIGWVTYPSASFSWVLSEEPFFPALPAVTSLRLRSAVGQSGLRPSFRDAAMFFNPVTARLQGSEMGAVVIAGAGNPALRPEISREVELGFQLGLINDRVGLDFTHYNKRSRDALINRNIAPSIGATPSRWENIGEVSNRGIEANLNARIVDLRNVLLDANLNYSTNRNRLEQLGEGVEDIIFGLGSVQRHVEGYPLGGYWQQRVTWEDRNNDGLIQFAEVSITDDAEFLGTPFPTREASLSTGLTLFNRVRLSSLFDYRGGHHLYNFTYGDRCAWEMVCEATYDMNASLRDQAGWIAWNAFGRNSSPYVEAADFVKLRELSLSLEAPQSLIARSGAQGLRLTLAGRNLRTWTDFTGLDPEVNTAGQANFSTAAYYTQPPVRYYTARVDINF